MILSTFNGNIYRSYVKGKWLLGLGFLGPYYLRKSLINGVVPDNERLV